MNAFLIRSHERSDWRNRIGDNELSGRVRRLACLILVGASFCSSQHTPSGPITINGQTGTVINNFHITSTTGDCLTVTNSTNIIIENSEIGPCGTASVTTHGNGITLKGNNGVYIYDDYIHSETASSQCCDHHDGLFGSQGNQNITIQGNVIAYGESNIEFTGANSMVTIFGNFLLNPRGPLPRGQNFQCWGTDSNHICSNISVKNNYALSSLDTTKYSYPENQEDSINFGYSSDAVVRNNYITGGHSHSGCGLIADDSADNMRFESNILLNTGQCGIGIADGTSQLVTGNKIYNTTPVPRGGNTAIYTWKQYRNPCGPTTVSNNVADMILSNGQHNAYWDGGGCNVTLSGNVFNRAADSQLAPTSSVFPVPLIPPQPKHCVVSSPYTTNTTSASGLPLCSSSSAAAATGNSK